jgi:transcription termination factor Rho
MLLPELQQLAGSMGIASGKLRKSDLVAAIQSAQVSKPAQAQARQATPSTPPAARATRAPREARGRAAQPAEPQTNQTNGVAETSASSDRAPAVSESAPNAAANVGTRESRTDGDRRERQGNRNQNGSQNSGSQNSNRSNRNNQPDRPQQGGQDRNQSSNQQDRSPDRSQGSNQQGSGQQGSGQQGSGQPSSNQQGDDDEYDSNGRRRGRRYRDRRGRNRERAPGGGGGNDVEPTVSEDDVLVPVAGILDAIEDKNAWFVRTEGYYASPDDVYVANSYVRRFGLRRGDTVTGAIKQVIGERREKYNPLVRLDTVNGRDPEQSRNRVEFTKLTPLYPQERLRLETEPHILTTRVIDLVMPIGKGQRALIVSPPKAGKTMVLQSIANAIATNNPEVHLMVVLIDERPEEVTDMQRSVKGEVIASTFDRRPQDHITVAELSIERAKRLVEMGHDVVVLLDSITRLGRAYNLGAPASGRILSGGVDSTALYPPKRFLGAARNIENGGSLTILATALVETGSAGDTVIFEEFKGTGNAELKLDRKIADKRVFPAVDVDQSSTRKEELLLSPDELAVTIKLRRVLHSLEQQQAIDLLLDRLKKSRTNIEFLMQIAKTTPGSD